MMMMMMMVMMMITIMIMMIVMMMMMMMMMMILETSGVAPDHQGYPDPTVQLRKKNKTKQNKTLRAAPGSRLIKYWRFLSEIYVFSLRPKQNWHFK